MGVANLADDDGADFGDSGAFYDWVNLDTPVLEVDEGASDDFLEDNAVFNVCAAVGNEFFNDAEAFAGHYEVTAFLFRSFQGHSYSSLLV